MENGFSRPWNGSEEGESLTRNETRSKERRNQQIRRGKHLIRVCEPLPPPPGSRAKENEEHFPIFVCGYDVGLNPPPPQNLECPIRDGIIDLVREESRVHTRNDNIFKGKEGSIPQLPSSFFVSKTWVTCFLQLSLSSFLPLFWLVRENSSTMQLRNVDIAS